MSQPYRRKSLRNPNINYRSGWWSVSIQVAKNKSIFGAIVGLKVVLNALGAAVEAYWRAACTAFTLGDTELLNRPRIAFVASQGFCASELKPRKIWAASKGSASADRVLISTFTSAQEREALRRALAKKRQLIAVFPAGIPVAGELDQRLVAAIRDGWALAISPQAPGSRLNKKIATWCNEFLLKNADEIWVGDLSPNGMLTQMLAGLGIDRRGFSRAENDMK